MKKDFIKGISIGLGVLFVFSLLGLVYAVGFHIAEEVLPGTFTGDYVFNGSINTSSGIFIDCPTNFTSIESQGRQLGCMQDTESASTGIYTVAASYCWTTYGGRLPFYSEWYIAMTHYTFTGETGNWEWVGDASPDGTTNNIAVAGFSGIDDLDDGGYTGGYYYRCWIPN